MARQARKSTTHTHTETLTLNTYQLLFSIIFTCSDCNYTCTTRLAGPHNFSAGRPGTAARGWSRPGTLHAKEGATHAQRKLYDPFWVLALQPSCQARRPESGRFVLCRCSACPGPRKVPILERAQPLFRGGGCHSLCHSLSSFPSPTPTPTPSRPLFFLSSSFGFLSSSTVSLVHSLCHCCIDRLFGVAGALQSDSIFHSFALFFDFNIYCYFPSLFFKHLRRTRRHCYSPVACKSGLLHPVNHSSKTSRLVASQLLRGELRKNTKEQGDG